MHGDKTNCKCTQLHRSDFLLFSVHNMPVIKNAFCLFVLLWVVLCSKAQQSVIKGSVTNAQTGEQLAYASITVNGASATLSDSSGRFNLQVNPGKVLLQVSLVGYNPLEQIVRIGFEEVLNINLELIPKVNELDRVVVSGSKQETKLVKEIMSVTIVKPYLIANTNSNTLSEVLNKVPGVAVIDGQATIRGGTGWSYDVGSRVMVLLDDMPLVGPDVGDIQWTLLPIEAAENIEVIKGPSSVLYGSSASAGTVSVRTGWPGNKPQTSISIFQGVTENPRNRNAIWWERTTQPFNTGSFYTHKQKFGQFDLVLSGNVNANRSHIQNNDEFRARQYIKTRYRFKKIKGLSVGINGTYMARKAGRFFLWQNADSGMLVPFDGSTGYDKYNIFSVDPHISYIQSNYQINVKYRFYSIVRDGLFGVLIPTEDVNDAVARINALDINVSRKLGKYFNNTSGIYLTSFNAIGNVYPERRTGYSGAAYTQLEYRKGRWNTTAGLRYEINALGPIEQTQRPLMRFGLNYQASSHTFLRLSYGEGFRFPTVVERYVDNSAAGIRIYPNPDLRTERGWYTEFGAKRAFSIGGFSGLLDACVFWMEYEDLIQLRFDQYERATFYIDTVNLQLVVVGEDKIGFKAINTPTSRIAGYEVSLEGEGYIGKVLLRTLCGYTFSYPVDISTDSTLRSARDYMQSFVNNMSFIDANNPAFNTLIPYRNRHLGKIDIEGTYKKVSIGYNASYFSLYEKIDNTLYVAIPGLQTFQESAGTGVWVHNIRIGCRLSQQVTIAALVNNIDNKTYAQRPARVDQPRNYNIQLRYQF
jgi:outer membrane receptor protein involved in Fe transport